MARSEERWKEIAKHMAIWISPENTCNALSLKMVLDELENSTCAEFSTELQMEMLT